jgi:rhamnosyltransferase
MYYKSQPAPEPQNICAIVVTYHPDEGLFERIDRICNQVDKVVIVDNHSSSNCLTMLKKISSKLGVHLILNDENLGIATALNSGVRYAIDCGDTYKWFLTLDQDTLPYTTMVKNLITAYNGCPYREQVGIIGSNYQERTTGEILFAIGKVDGSWAEVENLPTSGCLTSIRAFEEVGSFRDDLFIDYVDTEYCMRLRGAGFKVIISPKLCMQHPLGYYRPNKLYKLLCGRVMVTNYPPLRHYFWTRNGIMLAREYFWRDAKWSLKTIYYLLARRLVTVLLFEENKLLKLRCLCLGIYHAFFPKKIGVLNKCIESKFKCLKS